MAQAENGCRNAVIITSLVHLFRKISFGLGSTNLFTDTEFLTTFS